LVALSNCIVKSLLHCSVGSLLLEFFATGMLIVLMELDVSLDLPNERRETSFLER